MIGRWLCCACLAMCVSSQCWHCTNPYDVLELSHSATESEARKAFRKLSLEWHPDKNKRPEAQVRFMKLTRAYEAILEGHVADEPNPNRPEPEDFSEVIRELLDYLGVPPEYSVPMSTSVLVPTIVAMAFGFGFWVVFRLSWSELVGIFFCYQATEYVVGALLELGEWLWGYEGMQAFQSKSAVPSVEYKYWL